ncbi:serpin family protein [Sporosarcina aquimarina]|uniref:Serpin family protein n=1 Tax=Sporosarcina aquimarina TaxID=114975 RepID=A0ABU4FUZ9_9BACL|nr:serpin family protein [Sporosarcina aquimarina]MDW0108545.1 serpin family protein [Sporosarcina aquimarina]
MMNKKAILSTVISTALLLTACGTVKAPTKKGEPEPEKITASFGKEDYLNLSGPTNDLGMNLVPKAKPDDNGNVFVSPVSLLMALSMLQNGAEGQTKEEIIKAMQATGMDAESINRANASLLNHIQHSADDLTLQTANSIWVNDQYTLQDKFKKITHDYYLAEAEAIDSSNPKSADRMNEWVQKATNNKIGEIVQSPLDDSLVLFLLNAVYFKASWTYPFDESLTKNDEFQLTDGSVTEVPFMQLNEELPYLETEQFQAVSLPYGEQGNMKMDIYVPKEGHSIDGVLSSWTAENRENWNDSFEGRPGSVRLPKFQLDYEVLLNDVLQELGMEKAFSDDAELGTLVEEEKERLVVSKVLQKTYLSVDEKGTEAAGVTSIAIDTTSAPAGEPFEFNADKPFFLTIRDQKADILLFAGKISNPASNN